MFKVGDSVIANGYLPGVVTQVDVGYRIQNVPGGTETFWAEENLQLMSPEPKFQMFSKAVLIKGGLPAEVTIIGLSYLPGEKTFMYKIEGTKTKIAVWVHESDLTKL